ncbi:hypothetical protein [Okeania sp. KiyG1]|uniref:hypothetical protein n=1 Tax=Okeania sp. KiyG1 TaxID=2720165 RepID=UPI0019891E3C|nr:hypothetical protein [Okeania sp. KiyG1]GFZ99215.1 hypothetical protein CYANOKiyG1_10630 [Okeania sp. KiyG1]
MDQYLLLNYPRLWISKIPYVFDYGVWANIILNFLVFIFFSESSKSHLIDEFISFIIFIVMLIEVGAFLLVFKEVNKKATPEQAEAVETMAEDAEILVKESRKTQPRLH